MYLFSLMRHFGLISALRFRSAVRNPDQRLIRIKPKGHRAVYVRRTPTDLATVEEIFFDEGIYGRAAQLLESCEVYVDLGANIGLTCAFIHEHFPNSRIIAFEPHEGNFEVLRKNAPFAETHCGAAWSHDEGVSLRGDESAYNAFSVTTGGTIPSFSMNRILGIAGGKIDFLKIDIEGAEVELFKNRAWLRAVRMLAIEFHEKSRVQTDFDAVIRRDGMRIVSDTRHTTIAVRED